MVFVSTCIPQVNFITERLEAHPEQKFQTSRAVSFVVTSQGFIVTRACTCGEGKTSVWSLVLHQSKTECTTILRFLVKTFRIE